MLTLVFTFTGRHLCLGHESFSSVTDPLIFVLFTEAQTQDETCTYLTNHSFAAIRNRNSAVSETIGEEQQAALELLENGSPVSLTMVGVSQRGRALRTSLLRTSGIALSIALTATHSSESVGCMKTISVSSPSLRSVTGT